ncbi:MULTISPECIES: DUF4238 domain-containing protein [unclassified Vibrio]|uniref:DUF4238 domain-containing protein n=1 Tax=unclassified Vibrio TaxID=2614977 RepID=UPI001F437659|nr:MULTISPECIES: DUF4238 domain-containing protein [unclassified Vibrio]QXL80155.1 hypothetical protein [Vibrio sp.]
MKPKNKQIKIRHHHVWDYYLKRWSLDKKNIWYTSSKHNKISFDSTKGLAREDSFYKISYISKEQAQIIKRFSSKSSESLHKLHMSWLDDFLFIQFLEDTYKSSGRKVPEFEEDIEIRQHNMLENLHTKHESDARYIIDELANHNLNILEDRTNMIKFMIYFGHQISRTKTFKETVMAANRNVTEDDGLVITNVMRDCWWFFSYMFGMSFGQNIYLGKDKGNQCLLINNTDEPFITSDQPIVNVHSCTYSQDEALIPPEFSDFFYPISPTIGYMINDSNEFGKGIQNVSLETVQKLNSKVASHANLHIFGSTNEVVKRYKNLVGDNLKKVLKHTESAPL